MITCVTAAGSSPAARMFAASIPVSGPDSRPLPVSNSTRPRPVSRAVTLKGFMKCVVGSSEWRSAASTADGSALRTPVCSRLGRRAKPSCRTVATKPPTLNL